jgi:hypothetical protein
MLPPGTPLAVPQARSRIMPPSSLTRRVQILEEKVESLERLPARIDNLEVQILQFREEVRAEFSATREGMGGLRAEMLQLHEQALARIALTEAALNHEINQLDVKAISRDEEVRRQMQSSTTELLARIDETRGFMLMLHEDVVARIASMGESRG